MENQIEEPKIEKDAQEIIFDGVFDDIEVNDIYGDLKADSLNEMNYNELKEKYEKIEEEVKNLTESNNSLKRENGILKSNILSLYLTAKKEIERKDKEIKSFQKKEMNYKTRQSKKRKFDLEREIITTKTDDKRNEKNPIHEKPVKHHDNKHGENYSEKETKKIAEKSIPQDHNSKSSQTISDDKNHARKKISNDEKKKIIKIKSKPHRVSELEKKKDKIKSNKNEMMKERKRRKIDSS